MTSTVAIKASEEGLTPYPSGSLRELMALCLPIMLSLFSICLMGFVQRLLLTHFSAEALPVSLNANYLARLFQLPCMRVAIMAQVFVGLYRGSGNLQHVGMCIWQMIWFSFLSMLFVIPGSMMAASLFFTGTTFCESGIVYFFLLAFTNFLFPLGTALSAFYIGQGKTKIVVWTTLLAHALNIALTYILVFGVKNFIPPIGTNGAAIATIVAQALLCLILFFLFIQKSNREIFGTGNWTFQPKSCWRYLRPGIPRAFANILLLTAWTATAHVMNVKGGDYVTVLSVGGTVILFFYFIGDGISQSLTTILSNQIGSKDYDLIWKTIRSTLLFIAIIAVILLFPLVFFPKMILGLFYSTLPEQPLFDLLHRMLCWVWLFILGYNLGAMTLSLIIASRDTIFMLCALMFIWLTSYVPVYLAMNVWNWSPDKLWLIMGIDGIAFAIVYLLRARQERWKTYGIEPEYLTVE